MRARRPSAPQRDARQGTSSPAMRHCRTRRVAPAASRAAARSRSCPCRPPADPRAARRGAAVRYAGRVEQGRHWPAHGRSGAALTAGPSSAASSRAVTAVACARSHRRRQRIGIGLGERDESACRPPPDSACRAAPNRSPEPAVALRLAGECDLAAASAARCGRAAGSRCRWRGARGSPPSESPSPSALIGDRAVDEAIAHHPRAPRQRRPDGARDMIGARGGEQQCLGARVPAIVAAFQQQRADRLGAGAAAGLARLDHLQPRRRAAPPPTVRGPGSTCRPPPRPPG